MGRAPRWSKDGLNKGAWTALEDEALVDYVKSHGERKWSKLAKEAGLNRCGKSCRLRWMNYLRPGIKRGNISEDEEELIIRMHKLLGNRWTLIAGRLPGRTDNEIKNYWNSYLSKKMKDQFPLPKPGIEEKPVVRLENENKVAPGPSTDNDTVEKKLTTSELSSGLPQSITGKDKEEDFMLDLNSEDLFRRLDSDLAKLGIVDMNKLNPTIEGSACPFLPSEGIKDSGYGTECGHDDNNNKLYDLRSPLLHSDDGWLGDFVHTLFSD